MKRILFLALVLGFALAISACGGNSDDDKIVQGPDDTNTPDDNNDLPTTTSPPLVPVAESRAGTSYRHEIPYEDNNGGSATLVIQVYEPEQLVEGESYPLVLHGHGYGGNRLLAPDALTERLIKAGYYVISMDQRGFGESTGGIRSLSPDYEGQSLIAMLDWAEDLEGLRRRSNGEMMVGAYGLSYGGIMQFLLLGADPRHRLRVLAPDITPHDLTYSLSSNNAPKTVWVLGLLVAGETAGGPIPSSFTFQNPALFFDGLQRAELTGQDNIVLESVITAGINNRLSDASYNMFKYHSPQYFCNGEPAGPQNFQFATPDPLMVPPTIPPSADVLLSQGMKDTLFNVNEALANYECLKERGGDVRLVTHETGHLAPVGLSSIGLEAPLDPLYSLVTIPSIQDPAGPQMCGGMNVVDLRFAWFEEKLRGQEGLIDQAFSTGSNICLSLGEGDAIEVEEIQRGGEDYELNIATPQLNSLLGLVGSLLGSVPQEAIQSVTKLFTVPDTGAVLAGIPTLDITLSGLTGLELDECPLPVLPTACDPILYFALGRRPQGQQRWDVIDDQLTPVRGFGEHHLDMTAIAERLQPGEDVALMIFGWHPQYAFTGSRDILVLATQISGSVSLPMLDDEDILSTGF